MRRILKLVLAGGVTAMAGAIAWAATDTPPTYVTAGQAVDQATLDRFHFTDQGTRLIPAAWLAALEKPDGSGKVMNRADLEKYGFLYSQNPTAPGNPYGWPIGWTVSDPAKSDGIGIAGFTCAMCHTGSLDYKGKSVIVEGGQSMIDLTSFVNDDVIRALVATATDQLTRRKFFADAVAAGYPADRIQSDFNEAVSHFSKLAQSTPGAKVTTLPPGAGRLDAVQGIANRVFGVDLMMPSNQRDLSAPVSFPYLWDIWRLSWLQYNAFLGIAPDSRNVGEVLGVEAQTNLVDADGKLNPVPLRWQTSVQIKNLQWMEKNVIRALHAPTWPEDVLGPIDQAKAATGLKLFTANCSGCHGIKALPDGTWDVTVVPLDEIGTDPSQATHWAGETYDLSILGLGKETTATVGATAAINAIREQLYIDNDIPPAERQGDVKLLAPCGYKARPLIGIWATPPFLHNGAVPNVFDMISDTRPAKFIYGTRNYDPVHLGYTQDTTENDAVLDTSIAGNHNTGHWWTDDTTRPGRIGPKLSDDEKFAIIEYLKSATYENYPTEKRATPAKVACEDNPNWALAPAK